jgi:hypothetical protein
MAPKGLLLCSQELTTSHYSAPDEASQHPPILEYLFWWPRRSYTNICMLGEYTDICIFDLELVCLSM